MKFKQHEINKLYITLTTFSEYKLPFKIAHQINKVLQILEEQFKFCLKEEKKLYDIYKAEPQPNGLIKFSDDVDDKRKEAFAEEINELYNLEISDINLPPIIIREEYLSDIKMSPIDVKILSKIITFETDL